MGNPKNRKVKKRKLRHGLIKKGKYWHYRFKIRGIEFSGSTRCETIESAREVLKQVRNETVLGEQGKRNAPSLGAVISEWLKANSRAKSPKHIEAAMLAKCHLEPLLQVRLDRISNDIVELWRNDFLADHSPATADFALRYLKLFCRWGAKAARLDKIAFDMKPLNKRVGARPVVKAEQIDAFFEALDRRNKQISVAVRMHLRLAIRERAVLNLRWEDVDLEARTARVIEKGDEERILIIPSSVMEVFQLLLPRESSPWVFPAKDGKPHRKGWLRRPLERAGAAIGHDRFGVHRLRASFATIHKYAGTPVGVIQDVMGHSSIRTTQRYFEEDLEAQRKALEALEQRPNSA